MGIGRSRGFIYIYLRKGGREGGGGGDLKQARGAVAGRGRAGRGREMTEEEEEALPPAVGWLVEIGRAHV